MCGTSAAPRQTPLREGLDDDLTTHDGLHRQFVAVEQAHPNEWVDASSVHGDAAWSAIPPTFKGLG